MKRHHIRKDHIETETGSRVRNFERNAAARRLQAEAFNFAFNLLKIGVKKTTVLVSIMDQYRVNSTEARKVYRSAYQQFQTAQAQTREPAHA